MLGQLCQADAARDAVHVAIAPVFAAENLKPGQRVGLDKTGRAASSAPTIGVVDPFLKDGPTEGQLVYVCLFPNTVRSLRHEWEHPAFTNSTERQESEQWLRVYAAKLNTYDSPTEAFDNLMRDIADGHIRSHGTDVYSLSDLDNLDQLKYHVEIYLGAVTWEDMSVSCSC